MIDLSLPQLAQRVSALEAQSKSPLNWRGAYDAKLIYNPNDVVTYAGSTYVCIKYNFNQAPTVPAYWLRIPGTASGGFVNPMTSLWDLIIGDASGNPQRAAVGAPNSYFGVHPSGPLGYHLFNPMTGLYDMIYGGNPANGVAPMTRLAPGGPNTFLGINSAGNMGYRGLAVTDLPTRLVGDVIYDWSSTNPPTDYWTGGTAPANTWTTLGAWAFTPRRANSLVSFNIGGYIMLYAPGVSPAGSAIAWTTGLRLDAGGYIAFIGGGEMSLANNNGNVLDNASAIWLTSLSATTHTIYLDVYPSVSVPVYWRSASTPWERVHVEIVEFL